MAKMCFKEWLWETAAAETSHLHCDNGIFTVDMFWADCKMKNQSQSISGIGAKHENVMAERAIQTIIYMARTFMVHVPLNWCERGVDDLSLWGFAVKHSAWIHNHIPNLNSGLTPLKLLTKTRLIRWTYCIQMCESVQLLFLTQSCRTARKFLSGIDKYFASLKL
jgi:hypothetical protein